MAKGVRQPAAERFAANIEPDLNTGCWLWSGGQVGLGYACLSVNGKSVFAHRFSYEMHKGSIPAGLLVRHRCDTPACVNPEHLELGTHRDNAADRESRGRHIINPKLDAGDLLPKSWSEASRRRLRHYFTGRPCVNGHIAKRHTNGGCVECARVVARRCVRAQRARQGLAA